MIGEYVLVLAKVAEKRVGFIFLFYDVQMDFLGVDDFFFHVISMKREILYCKNSFGLSESCGSK